MRRVRFVSRERAGLAEPRKTTPRPLSSVSSVVYHHTAGVRPSVTVPSTRVWRDVQRLHMGRGYADIAYNVGIGPAGSVLIGRDIAVRGAHSDGALIAGFVPNVNALSIVFLGNYEVDELTDRQREAALFVEWLWAVRLGRALVPLTHRETDVTACPGRHVQAWVESRR